MTEVNRQEARNYHHYRPREKERKISLDPPSTISHHSKMQETEQVSIQFYKDGVPRVGLYCKLRVIETISGGCFLAANLKAFPNEKISLEIIYVLVVEVGKTYGVLPSHCAIITMTRVLGDAGDVFIKFGRCDIILMLPHSHLKTYMCLSYIFGVRRTRVGLLFLSTELR